MTLGPEYAFIRIELFMFHFSLLLKWDEGRLLDIISPQNAPERARGHNLKHIAWTSDSVHEKYRESCAHQ